MTIGRLQRRGEDGDVDGLRCGMHITWFHPTADGGSIFEDLDVALLRERTDAEGHVIRGSNYFASPSVQLANLPAGLDQTWHPAPRRQIVVILSGTLEVTTADNVSRQFGPGQMFLADDMGTRGHLTRAVDGAVEVLFAPMPPEVDLTAWRSATA
jgi:quercetin dioxygenase-like cupin family protein